MEITVPISEESNFDDIFCFETCRHACPMRKGLYTTVIYLEKDIPLFSINLRQPLKNEENANQSPLSFRNITI
jgi:hypothetical protein